MRMYRSTLSLLSVMAWLLGGAVPSGAVTTHGPISVSKCSPEAGGVVAPPAFVPAYYPPSRWYWNDVYGYRYYQRPVASNPTLAIDYVNVSPHPIKSIEFGLVARGALIAEVRDVGTFSPGAEIKHTFGLSPNVFPIGTGLPQCVALRAQYADSTKWKNASLPALRRSLYGSP